MDESQNDVMRIGMVGSPSRLDQNEKAVRHHRSKRQVIICHFETLQAMLGDAAIRSLHCLLIDTECLNESTLEKISFLRFPLPAVLVSDTYCSVTFNFAINHGCNGYMLWHEIEIHHGLERLMEFKARHAFLTTPSVSTELANLAFSFPATYMANFETLTMREKVIGRLIVAGLRYKEMAEHLSLSINTIRAHIRSIYKKLKVAGREQAIDLIEESNSKLGM